MYRLSPLLFICLFTLVESIEKETLGNQHDTFRNNQTNLLLENAKTVNKKFNHILANKSTNQFKSSRHLLQYDKNTAISVSTGSGNIFSASIRCRDAFRGQYATKYVKDGATNTLRLGGVKLSERFDGVKQFSSSGTISMSDVLGGKAKNPLKLQENFNHRENLNVIKTCTKVGQRQGGQSGNGRQPKKRGGRKLQGQLRGGRQTDKKSVATPQNRNSSNDNKDRRLQQYQQCRIGVQGRGPGGFKGPGAISILYNKDKKVVQLSFASDGASKAVLKFYRRNGAVIQVMNIDISKSRHYIFKRNTVRGDIAGITIYPTGEALSWPKFMLTKLCAR